MPSLKKKAILEIMFKDDKGVGIGPTLEFYNLLSKQIGADKDMWREYTPDNTLFPRALPQQDSEQLRKTCSKFEIVGFFLARSILDDRLISLPISPLMWHLLLER